jgi:DNA-binding response OmpR family regulator
MSTSHPKATILVIDDEMDMVELIQTSLIPEGYQVFSASNGQEGLEKLPSSLPDLIILDINMPKMNGITFCHEMHQKHGFKVPVLIISARPHSEHLIQELQVDGFLDKPFSIDDLLFNIKQILSHRARPRLQS